jgi:hypothetical protein
VKNPLEILKDISGLLAVGVVALGGFLVLKMRDEFTRFKSDLLARIELDYQRKETFNTKHEAIQQQVADYMRNHGVEHERLLKDIAFIQADIRRLYLWKHKVPESEE